MSLWLHSFTVGAPLSFLDHHLRCGDALIGLRVLEASDYLREIAGLYLSSAITGAEQAAKGMQQIEEKSDADIAEVRESTELFQGVDEMTAELRRLLDFLCSIRWLTAGMKKKERIAFETTQLIEPLGRAPDQAYKLLANGPNAVNPPSSGDGEDPLFRVSGAMGPSRHPLPAGKTSCIGRRPFRGFGAIGKTSTRKEVLMPSSATRPGIASSCKRWSGLRPGPRISALASTAAARRTGIQKLRDQGVPLAAEFDAAKDRADTLAQLIRRSGHYPLLGGGDINLYSLFVERAMTLIKPSGLVGLLTPSGIYADKTAARFFKTVSTNGRVGGLFDIENKKIFFKDIHASFKFCAFIFGGEKRYFDKTPCAFFLHETKTINNTERCFPLAPEDFARVNPNTGTAPVFRTQRDAGIIRGIYERHPVLVDRSGGGECKAWPVKYVRMFDMTNDSRLFRTGAQLDAKGFYPVQGNRWKRGEELYLPLYEGKMVEAYDHRAASVVINPANLNRPAQSRDATVEEHTNPDWLPDPQFWVPESECGWAPGENWVLGFKEITSPTNAMTFIAALFPAVGFGNKVPIFKPETKDRNEWLLAANFNAMPFNFVTRQKVHGQTLNLFIVEQLPVIASADYDRCFGSTSARDIVQDHVLRLTFTAHHMAPFARDLGYQGPPFVWNQEKRRHLRARLDALYFHLYGLSREDASYMLDTFPIVRREDEAQFGSYRSKKMILAYMNALAAGDTQTLVAV